jgi:hypothetical protein
MKQAAVLLSAIKVVAGSYADVFGTGPNQFSIDFVDIGNAGNAADSSTGYGADAPASFASWYEAEKFCNWLTTGNAYTGAYPFYGGGVLQAVDRARKGRGTGSALRRSADRQDRFGGRCKKTDHQRCGRRGDRCLDEAFQGNIIWRLDALCPPREGS